MQHFDIIIIGAGIAGIDAACHFSMNLPNKTYAIFESRNNIGGTWDLFKYPGIRSDSDMHTFSYGFKPWKYHKSIADGATIMQYLKETVAEYQIDDKIRFHHLITELNWSSDRAQWTVKGINQATNEVVTASCNFLMICTGYYDYDEGYTPDYKGLESYEGEFVHPQKWTEDIDYTDKKIIVIGSGATAVSLIPSLTEKAEHVTMLQRSPTYIISRPLYDRFAQKAHRLLPVKWAHTLTRWKNILLGMFFYSLSKKRPNGVKKYIQTKIKQVLGDDYDINTHFNPRYKPWDERLCAVPDNDFFYAIKEGQCSVLTDHIDTFTPKGIRLKSGEELEADLIITATGLQIKMAGGIKIRVDGKQLEFSDLLSYKGAMLQDLPNAASVIGYINSSWTLKADLICTYVCRLIQFMDQKGYKSCTPKLQEGKIHTRPVLDLTSGYIKRSLDKMPKQGDVYPWEIQQNYIKDLVIFKYRKIDDGHLLFE